MPIHILPVEASSGPRGWVMEEAIERDTWLKMKCVARRRPDGSIFFIYGGKPPGS